MRTQMKSVRWHIKHIDLFVSDYHRVPAKYTDQCSPTNKATILTVLRSIWQSEFRRSTGYSVRCVFLGNRSGWRVCDPKNIVSRWLLLLKILDLIDWRNDKFVRFEWWIDAHLHHSDYHKTKINRSQPMWVGYWRYTIVCDAHIDDLLDGDGRWKGPEQQSRTKMIWQTTRLDFKLR